MRHGTYRGRLVQLVVDGENTFNENICDIEALDILSRQLWARVKKQQSLPGVNFTKEQTFFLNIAQVKIIFLSARLQMFVQGYCGTMGTLSHVLFTHLSQHATYRERLVR